MGNLRLSTNETPEHLNDNHVLEEERKKILSGFPSPLTYSTVVCHVCPFSGRVRLFLCTYILPLDQSPPFRWMYVLYKWTRHIIGNTKPVRMQHCHDAEVLSTKHCDSSALTTPRGDIGATIGAPIFISSSPAVPNGDSV